MNWKKILSILLVLAVVAVLVIIYFKYREPKEEILPEGPAVAQELTEAEIEITLEELNESAKGVELSPSEKAKILNNISNL